MCPGRGFSAIIEKIEVCDRCRERGIRNKRDRSRERGKKPTIAGANRNIRKRKETTDEKDKQDHGAFDMYVPDFKS